jgi:polar amino acid transport system substrate-binding protein
MLKLAGHIITSVTCIFVSSAVSAETVRVAILERFPPLIETRDGHPSGPLIDKLVAASKRAGLNIAFIPTTLDEWQKVIADGRADAFYPMAITPAFQQVYEFSEPTMSSGGGLFVRAPEQTPSGLAALEGKIVVTPQAGPLAAHIAKTAPKVNLVLTKDYDESFARLLSGEADAAALNLQVGRMMVAQLFPEKITPAAVYFWELPLALVVPRSPNGRPAFLKKINREIVALRDSDQSGK